MKISAIRQQFINFFEGKKHQHIPAAPIVNQDNPQLLFVNAGMNPLTPIFLGNSVPPFPRAVNSQPCIRVTGKHNDLEEVGHDTYHHTLFEMLGNWSFGDYFKQEAIAWAWELLTEVYQLSVDRLYVTFFEGLPTHNIPRDEESLQWWQHLLPSSHILPFGAKDNFWEMGSSGPCGPCTEIHIDLRSERERREVAGAQLVNQQHPEVIEIWNLVFMQYLRKTNQEITPLPARHVDTGMGLERLAMVLQGKTATYDTDAFTPLIQWVTANSKVRYGENRLTDSAIRVVVDHIRTITFAIADGQLPGTQKAGYVVRRLLRRALRYGYTHLGYKKPFLHQLVPLVVENMGEVYPQLVAQAHLVAETIAQEESNFLRTLSGGLKRLQTMVTQMKPTQKVLEGNKLFELYDTFGFPMDLSRTILQEQGLAANEAGFAKAMQAQKARSKQATQCTATDWEVVVPQQEPTLFIGYHTLHSTARVVRYRQVILQGQPIYQLILDRTPFYPEGGGQVGDRGVLSWADVDITVVDTKKEQGLITHYTRRLPTNLRLLSQPCEAKVDATLRQRTACNHTATHLLHAALQHILGSQTVQQGSLVTPEKLRFDFTHPHKVSSAALKRVQQLVNEKIRANLKVTVHKDMLLATAKARGAMALFGEKYGEHVRVVTCGSDFSTEVCGGTHVDRTGCIGFFHITLERSVASGIRRIEAITGSSAETYFKAQQVELERLSELLRSPRSRVEALETLIHQHKTLRKKWNAMKQQQQQQQVAHLQVKWEHTGSIACIAEEVKVATPTQLQQLAFALSTKEPAGLVVLATIIGERAYIAVVAGQSLLATTSVNDWADWIKEQVQGKRAGKQTFTLITCAPPVTLSPLLAKVKAHCQVGRIVHNPQ